MQFSENNLVITTLKLALAKYVLISTWNCNNYLEMEEVLITIYMG